MEEYLSTRQLAERLDLAPKTIRNKISARVFKKGVHYFTPPGLDGPRFKWSAIVAWLEDKQEKEPDVIPLSKGTVLRLPTHGVQSHS
jgi:hypothetical protein